MITKKILITGGDKATRFSLAETIFCGCEQQYIKSIVVDLGKYDVIASIEIPKTISTAIFVADQEGKKFTGIYERLIKASPDKLCFLHIELK